MGISTLPQVRNTLFRGVFSNPWYPRSRESGHSVKTQDIPRSISAKSVGLEARSHNTCVSKGICLRLSSSVIFSLDDFYYEYKHIFHIRDIPMCLRGELEEKYSSDLLV